MNKNGKNYGTKLTTRLLVSRQSAIRIKKFDREWESQETSQTYSHFSVEKNKRDRKGKRRERDQTDFFGFQKGDNGSNRKKNSYLLRSQERRQKKGEKREREGSKRDKRKREIKTKERDGRARLSPTFQAEGKDNQNDNQQIQQVQYTPALARDWHHFR